MAERRTPVVNEKQALRIVTLIGEAHQDAMPSGAARADLARALSQAMDVSGVPNPNDSDAAAIAVQLLAEDPRFTEPVKAMMNGPQAKSLGPGVVEGACLIAGLLMALQTHFEFVRDKDGRFSLKIRKKPTSEALLKPLIKKLTDLLGLPGTDK
jgi:hypothetical protein